MRILMRLGPYVRGYRKEVTLVILSLIFSGIFMMVGPLLIRYAIDLGLDPQQDATGKVVDLDGNAKLLIFASAAVIVFALGRGIAQFGQQFLGESIGQRVAYDIRNDIYDNLQRLSYAYHDTAQTGQIMSRVTQDVESIRMFVGMALFRLASVAIMLVVAVAGMFYINWHLAIISCITIPFVILLSWKSSRVLRPLWTQIQESQAEMTQVAEEGLTGIRVVKAFSREDFEGEKFAKASRTQAELSLHSSIVNATFTPLNQSLGYLQVAITVGVGSWLISRGSLSAADLLTFTLWLGLLQMPVRMLGFTINFITRAIASGERIFELIDVQSAVQEKPGALELPRLKGHVQFKDVSFGYDAAADVLSDLDIDAKPGQVIALLGPTGSGKSTVVNLIPRFYDVTKGSVTVDGIDVRDATFDSLRGQIGIVQQDVFLFIGTIRDNIAYGRPEATPEDIERAAKAARIHDFIVSLPDGYNEWVGERGVTLSGGQKQRIAIARTLLLDPSILIFDDSTASVDAQTEFLIQQALQELMHERTTFVIAQRLRTVMRADEIVVLDHGRVVQRGKHDDLLTQEGLYRRIFDLELKDQEEALGHHVDAPVAVAAGSNGHGPNGNGHNNGDAHDALRGELRPAGAPGGGGAA